MKKWIVPLLFASAAGVANASTIKGFPVDVRLEVSQVNFGFVRVSIKLTPILGSPGTTTACSAGSWFAFEYADFGPGALIGKVWENAAQTAGPATGTALTITGTGTCDAAGAEGVKIIDVMNE